MAASFFESSPFAVNGAACVGMPPLLQGRGYYDTTGINKPENPPPKSRAESGSDC